MLVVVEDMAGKQAAQKAVERTITAALTNQGKRIMGFRSGNMNEIIYSHGDGKLWCAFGLVEDANIPRRWNAFGVFDSKRRAQTITVEINIPTEENSGRGRRLLRSRSGERATYLMHDGGVGGGKPGVGRNAFLASSKEPLHEVASMDGPARPGIVVGDVNSEDLPSRLWRFVKLVRDFKIKVSRGDFDNEEARSAVAEWDKFNSESSGRRRGTRSAQIDYVSYHGDVVQRLYEERITRRKPGEKVRNSRLVDLYVRSGNKITEIYEFKTSLDRQALYAAIGQIITHSVGSAPDVTRVLVIPMGIIASDLKRCIELLSIDVRRIRTDERSGSASRPVLNDRGEVEDCHSRTHVLLDPFQVKPPEHAPYLSTEYAEIIRTRRDVLGQQEGIGVQRRPLLSPAASTSSRISALMPRPGVKDPKRS